MNFRELEHPKEKYYDGSCCQRSRLPSCLVFSFHSFTDSKLPSPDLLSSPIAAQTSPTPKEEEKVSEEDELEIEIGSEEESEVGAEERVDTDEDVQTEDRTITFK